MSNRAKKIRRIIEKQSKAQLHEVWGALLAQPLSYRLVMAWRLIRGAKAGVRP